MTEADCVYEEGFVIAGGDDPCAPLAAPTAPAAAPPPPAAPPQPQEPFPAPGSSASAAPEWPTFDADPSVTPSFPEVHMMYIDT